jgi:hypothetical protein
MPTKITDIPIPEGFVLSACLIYDPQSRGVQWKVEPGIPHADLINAIELLKAITMEQQLQGMANAALRAQSSKIEVANGIPPAVRIPRA